MKNKLIFVTTGLCAAFFATATFAADPAHTTTLSASHPMQKVPVVMTAIGKTVSCKPQFEWTYGLTAEFVKQHIDPSASPETISRRIKFALKESSFSGASARCYYDSYGSSDHIYTFGYWIQCNNGIKVEGKPHTFKCQ